MFAFTATIFFLLCVEDAIIKLQVYYRHWSHSRCGPGQDKALSLPEPCNLLKFQIGKNKPSLAKQPGMIQLGFAHNIAFLGKYQQKPSLLAITIPFRWCYKELESWFWKQPCHSDVQPKWVMAAAAMGDFCVIRNVLLFSTAQLIKSIQTGFCW